MNKKQILEVRQLTIDYSEKASSALDVSFSIGRGQVFGLTGESGSGKSSICKAVLGLLRNRAKRVDGSILLCGQELMGMEEERRRKINGRDIGYIMQNPMTAFDPCMTIRSHFVETVRTHLRCNRKDAVYIGEEGMNQVGLKDVKRLMGSYPHQLSGGMLQRVMIALAIVLNPVLIIADEPTTANVIKLSFWAGTKSRSILKVCFCFFNHHLTLSH